MFDSKSREQRCDSHFKPCLEVNIAFVFSIHWLQTPVLFTFTSLFLAQRSAVQRLFFACCLSQGMACQFYPRRLFILFLGMTLYALFVVDLFGCVD